MKKQKRYSNGGQIASSLAGLIPGVGSIISPVISTFDNIRDQSIQDEMMYQQQLLMQQNNQRMLQPFAKGGFANDNFKQFSTGSHSSGNDLPINQFGNPDMNGSNLVQNKENTYPINGKTFVMSDTLTNPETGNKFNMDADKLQKKYKDSRFYPEQKKSLELGMKRLATLNLMGKEKSDMKQGMNKMYNGTWPFPDKPIMAGNMNYSLGEESVPSANNMFVNTPDGNINNPININPLPQRQPTISNPIPPSPARVANTNSILDRTQPTTGNTLSNTQVANGIALGLKGLALGRSIYDAVQPAENESLIKPDYTKSDRYVRDATINYNQARQDALGVSNIGANMNRTGSSGYNQMLGREAARLGQLGDQLGRISEAEVNANSQLNLTKGQYEQGKSVDTANRQYQNRIDNQMNQANQRGFQRDLFSNLSQIGTEFNKYSSTQSIIKNQKEINTFKNSQTLAYLNNKYPNFQISPDIIQKFTNGELDMDGFLSYLPSNIQQDIKTNDK